LSSLDIDSLKIQEDQEETEQALTLLSGSENSSINNIELTIPMHNNLIFKEQAKVKGPGLREKVSPTSVIINQYNISKDMIIFLLLR
jgi:hypothetical protein